MAADGKEIIKGSSLQPTQPGVESHRVYRAIALKSANYSNLHPGNQGRCVHCQTNRCCGVIKKKLKNKNKNKKSMDTSSQSLKEQKCLGSILKFESLQKKWGSLHGTATKQAERQGNSHRAGMQPMPFQIEDGAIWG